MSQDMLTMVLKLIHSDGEDLVLLDKLSTSWGTLEAGDGVSDLCHITNCFLNHTLGDKELLSTAQKGTQLLPKTVVAFIISSLRNPESCHFDSAEVSHIAEVVEQLLKFTDYYTENTEDYSGTPVIFEELAGAISSCLGQLVTAADFDNPPAALYLSIASLLPLAKAFQSVSLDECYAHILRLLMSGKSHDVTTYILTRFLPAISSSRQFASFIEKAFSFIVSLFSTHTSDDLAEVCPHMYVILTSFIEHVHFTFGKASCPLTSELFWSVVQSGLVNGDSLTRKRSMYVVRKILSCYVHSELEIQTKLFHCAHKEQLESWRVLLIILEVLEEKQPHAVKPALAKFCTVLEQYNPSDHMHVSWILTVFHRMFLHESRTVVKWALSKFMGTESVIKFMFEENEHKFLCGPLVDVLNKPGLFTREEGDLFGSPMLLAKCLTNFLELCEVQLSRADQFRTFVPNLFAAVVKQTWNGVSLVHVSFALSHLRPMPVLSGDLLHSIGNMLTNIQRFQEPILRAAVQCYWLDISLRLIDPDKVTFEELSTFLSVFKQDGTLKRGTEQWNRTAQRIGELNNMQAVDFVRGSIREILECDADCTKQGICRVARIAVMLHDCGVLAQPSQWEELLGDSICILSSAASRPYLSLHRKQAAMALFLALQEEATSLFDDSFQHEIMDLLSPFAEVMYEHVYSSAFAPLTNMNDFQASLTYFHFLDVLSARPTFRSLLYTLMNEGLHKCSLLLEENSVGSTISVWRFLSWAATHFPEKKQDVDRIVVASIMSGGLGQPLHRPLEWNIQDSILKAQWVTIETSIMELIWDTIRKTSLCAAHCKTVTAQAMEALQISAQESSLHILRALASVTAKLEEEIDVALLTRCFELSWQTCKDLKKSNLFRPSVETFVAIAFQPQFLRSELKKHLMQIIEDIQELGEVIPGVFNALVKHLLSIWRSPGNQDLLEECPNTLVKALTYGPIYRKDQKSVFDTEAFVASQGNTLAVNQLLKSEHKLDAEVRIRGITFIVQLNPAIDCDLAAKLCNALLAHDKGVSSVRKRYFGNSAVHRMKNRVWQAILCLQYLLDEASSKRTGSVCSFVAMLVHLSSSLELDQLEAHLLEFLPELLPWSMGQHFNARVYAQVALHLAAQWSTQHELGKVREMYHPVFLSIERDIGNWSKNVQKLLDDFYFRVFNAAKHWTAEAIFYDLPRLTGLTDQELVSVQAIEELMLEDQADTFLPLRNPDDVLSASCPSFWIDGEQEVSVSREGDFQKKITPWKQNLSADYSERQSSSSHKGDIVVVASLIDRIPNLGGLCRTCEVFGAHTFVLNSLKHMEDRQFQNLSVSSETWLSVEEVKAHQLREYLPQKKDEGYTLVGLEQTTGSLPLQQYRFPKKSLLLLGNEKEGLPVELIQLLDVCVEIPQQGVVRSLNVHVSGAIAIWEYTRQHQLSL
ncbi:probable methyltransferase TARBP1 isoform X2 [Ornithodoros turicata]|uniref:probable methyltransferase TARBP1 isoform X2 n=1 Tax=Ornithodoros turicata TaxID=34597 RepID=UPI00313A1AF4